MFASTTQQLKKKPTEVAQTLSTVSPTANNVAKSFNVS